MRRLATILATILAISGGSQCNANAAAQPVLKYFGSYTGYGGTVRATQPNDTLNVPGLRGISESGGLPLWYGATWPGGGGGGGGTWGGITGTIGNQTDLAAALSARVPTSQTVNGHALSGNVTVTKSDVGLGLAENTALSTWAGSANITTLGTLSTGVIPFSLITSTPTSLAGYGINNGVANTLTVNGHTLASNITVTPADLGLTIGTNTQAYSANLTTYAGIAPTSNAQTFLANAVPNISLGVLSVAGVSSTAADGTHFVLPYNTTSCPTCDSGMEGALCTLPAGLQVCHSAAWSTAVVGASATIATPTLTGQKETVTAGGTCSTSYNINPTAGTMITLTLSGACTIGVTNLAAGHSFVLFLTQSSTTTPTFSSAFKWPGGTVPSWSSTATKYDTVACASPDGSKLICNALLDGR
jgi:hypothetical protein